MLRLSKHLPQATFCQTCRLRNQSRHLDNIPFRLHSDVIGAAAFRDFIPPRKKLFPSPSSFHFVLALFTQLVLLNMAEPFSIALGTIALLRTVGRAVLSVRTMYHGIRDVRESTRGLGEDLEAFNFSLTTILNMEIRNGSVVRDIQGSWGVPQLDALLTNARTTFLRLETIFGEISRERNILRRPREYIRTNRYDQEISHLRLRINTYISAVNVPVVLLAM
jgi:hypothetical protein